MNLMLMLLLLLMMMMLLMATTMPPLMRFCVGSDSRGECTMRVLY